MTDYRFDRECRTPYSEAYSITKEEEVVGRVDLHYTSGVVYATLCVNEEISMEAIQDLTGGAGADAVIECAGVEATGILAGRIARRKGRVVVLGVFEKPAPLDYIDLVYGEKTVTGSMGGYGVFDEAIQMMADGTFDGEPLITGKIGLDDILTAGFDALIKHKEENVKILVSPKQV